MNHALYFSLLLIYYARRTEAEISSAIGVHKLLSLWQCGNGHETWSGDVTGNRPWSSIVTADLCMLSKGAGRCGVHCRNGCSWNLKLFFQS
jgi:hypothetical protein